MPSRADPSQATYCVAVIEVDVGDPCPSTLVPQLDEALTFVLSNASPAGYRWHELHIVKGATERESLVVSSTLRLLAKAHAEGSLSDFRIVEGARYLESPEPFASGTFATAPAGTASMEGSHASS